MAHAIQALLSHYDGAFETKFGARYPGFTGKDAALAKQLLAIYTLEQLTAWVDQFFALEDEWIAQSGYSFGVFKSQLGKVIAMKKSKPTTALTQVSRRRLYEPR